MTVQELTKFGESMGKERFNKPKSMALFESQPRTVRHWPDAPPAFAAWRVIERNHGGVLSLDLDERKLTASPPE